MSADQAKEKLISSLNEDETEAMSYVNEIMEEAKMTANMEAKKDRGKTINGWPRKLPPKTPYLYSIRVGMKSKRTYHRTGSERNIRAAWKQPPVLEIIVDDTRGSVLLPDLTR